MQFADIPDYFPIPFADDAGPSYIRPIPEASQIGVENGAASLTDGFPPLTFLAVGAGGVPPFGQDFNGLLNQVTKWTQWQGAGAPVPYNSGYATSIGGYPKGATVAHSTIPGATWTTTVDNNATDPESGGTNWIPTGIAGIQKQSGNFAAATGTANTYAATYDPPVTAHQIGVPLRFTVPVGSVVGAATFNPGPGVKALKRGLGNGFFVGDLSAGGVVYTAIYDGTSYRVIDLISQSIAGGGGVPSTNVPNTGTFTTILDLTTLGVGSAYLWVTAVHAGTSQSWSGMILAVQFASGTGAGNTPPSNVSVQNGPGTVAFQVLNQLVQMSITGGGGTYAVSVKVIAT